MPTAKSTRQSISIHTFGTLEAWYAQAFEDIAAHWPSDAPNPFISGPYLAGLEKSLPPDIGMRYLVLFKDRQPVGWFVLQLVEFRTVDHVQDEKVWSGWWGRIKYFISSFGNYRILVLGNLLSTGDHSGFFLLPEAETAVRFEELPGLLRRLARQEGAPVLMAKDYHRRQSWLERDAWNPLDFQPDMILDLPPNWHSFEDYLADMSSKYRVRARRAHKKAEGLAFQELSLGQIELLANELFALYDKVVRSAGFSLAKVEPAYFVEMKRRLGPDYHLEACFAGDELVGFFTTIRNGTELEANFIGFDNAFNREHQLYLNMLYRMVEQGIRLRVQRIVFARTAMEIKSSVGAVAHDIYLYLVHRTAWKNALLPFFVRLMEPKEHWMPRHPFSK